MLLKTPKQDWLAIMPRICWPITLLLIVCLANAPLACAHGAAWGQLNAAGDEEFNAGHLTQAYDLWTQALTEADKLEARDPRQAIALTNLAKVCRRLEKNDQAESLYKRALATWPATDAAMTDLVQDYYAFLRKQGKDAQAAELESKAGKKFLLTGAGQPTLVGSNTSDQFKDEYTNWEALYRSEKYKEAGDLARAKIKQMDETGKDNGHLPAALNFLISTLFAQSNYQEAEPVFFRYLQIVRQTKGEKALEYGQGLKNYAALLRRNGKGLEADANDRQADQILALFPEYRTTSQAALPNKSIYAPGVIKRDEKPLPEKQEQLIEGVDNSDLLQRSRNILRPRSGGY